MKLSAEPTGSRHRLTWMVAAFALVSCALLGLTSRAHASETIYWDNYDGHSIGAANIDGTGGRLLDLGSTVISGAEGLAYDPVNGRIYIDNWIEGKIEWVGIHGGSGVLNTGTAPVDKPKGIAVDPATQTVYWANYEKPEAMIGYASADNSGVGGALDTSGASEAHPSYVALDTKDGRIYWMSEDGNERFVSYANLNNTGGGDLPVAKGELSESWSGINVEPATGRLYILGEEEFETAPGEFEEENLVYWLNLSGVGGGEVDTENAVFNEAYGLAFDPSLNRFYWGNYEAEPGEPTFGMATLAAGGGSSITIAEGAPGELTSGPQDPVVLKSPSSVTAPQVSASGAALSCSQGAWSQDYVGSNVYGAPESYGYQWSKDGQSIGGATGTTLTATQSGSYTCTVTATNQFGSGSQASSGYTVTVPPAPVVPVSSPASLKLTSASKKKAKVQAGKVATLTLDLANVGGTSSSGSKVCMTLSKKAKKGLVAPKCVAVAPIAPGKTSVITLKVKTKGGARGTYKFSVVVSGTGVSATLAQQVTVTPMKHGKKKHGKK